MAEEEIDIYEHDNLSEEDIDYEEIKQTSGKSNTEDVTEFIDNYEKRKKKYKTSPVLSKYERTRVLSERAQQLENGTRPYISNSERFTTSYAIAVE